ncbi:hypothetical protein Tco_1420024 [Tanacetum coccineum]
MWGMSKNEGYAPLFIVEQALEAKEKEVRCHDPGVAELWSLQGLYGGSRVIKATNDKDYSLMFRVFKLMKCVSEDSGDELEYPRELFLE